MMPSKALPKLLVEARGRDLFAAHFFLASLTRRFSRNDYHSTAVLEWLMGNARFAWQCQIRSQLQRMLMLAANDASAKRMPCKSTPAKPQSSGRSSGSGQSTNC